MKCFMSLRSSADNENQRSLHMVLSVTRHAGAGRHPSDPPRLNTGLRRDDGPQVTIPQVNMPKATIFYAGTKDTKGSQAYSPTSCASCLRGEKSLRQFTV